MTVLKYETYIGHPAAHYSMLLENDFDKIKVLFIKIVYDFRYKSRASARNKKKTIQTIVCTRAQAYGDVKSAKKLM